MFHVVALQSERVVCGSAEMCVSEMPLPRLVLSVVTPWSHVPPPHSRFCNRQLQFGPPPAHTHTHTGGVCVCCTLTFLPFIPNTHTQVGLVYW